MSGHHRIYHAGAEMEEGKELDFGDVVRAGAWCAIAVTDAETDNMAGIDNMMGKVRDRRIVFVSASKKVGLFEA